MSSSGISPSRPAPGERIVHEVTSWAGISTQTGPFAETAFYVNGQTIGHVHGDWQADVPFPREMRDQLVAEGRAAPHHVYPDSGWTTIYIQATADVDAAIELLRLNYDRIMRKAGKRPRASDRA